MINQIFSNIWADRAEKTFTLKVLIMLFKVNAKKSFEEISLGWCWVDYLKPMGRNKKENALKT